MTIRASLRARGQFTLPKEIRVALAVEEGDELEFEVTPEGVNVRGMRLIATDQAWFWTPEWQSGERRANEDIIAGRTTTYDSGEDFLESLG